MAKEVRNACINPVSELVFNKLLLKTPSFVTDGTNCYTGEKGGLWTLVKRLRKELAGDDEIISQLLTPWLGGGGAVTASVQEITKSLWLSVHISENQGCARENCGILLRKIISK